MTPSRSIERPPVATGPDDLLGPVPPTRPGSVGPLEAIRRQPLTVLVPIVLLVAAAVAAGLTRTPQYTAITQLNVGPTDVPPEAIPGVVAGSSTLANSYARAVGAPGVLVPLRRQLALAHGSVAATSVSGSTVILVQATGTHPSATVVLANAAGRQLITYVQGLNESPETQGALQRYQQAQLEANRADSVHEALRRALHANHNDAVRARLRQAAAAADAADLRASTAADAYRQSQHVLGSSRVMQVLAPAVGAQSDRDSVLQRLVLIGLAAGIVLGVALALVRANASRR